MLARRPDGITVAPFERGEIGPDLFRAACRMGLEGLVSKHRDGPYRGGRQKHPETRKKDVVWFALNNDRPLFAFAGIWTTFNGDRGTKSKPVPGPHQVYGFLTTAPNAVVAPTTLGLWFPILLRQFPPREPRAGAHVREPPDPQLWTLQVGEDRNRPAGFPLDRADDVVTRLMVLVAAMAEIKAKHVGTGVEQRTYHFGI